MANQSSTMIGSGTIPFVVHILPSGERGIQDGGQGFRYGTNVIVTNPEDVVAVDAFAVSGVTVGTTAVEIVGPHTNPLSRSRLIILQNEGASDVLLSHKESFTDIEGFALPADAGGGEHNRLELPLLHNNTIWGRTAAGSATVKILIF